MISTILGLLIIMMMGSYNARLIYPIGYSRRRCGATAALIRQPQTPPHNKEPENTEQNFMGRGPIFITFIYMPIIIRKLQCAIFFTIFGLTPPENNGN